MTGSHNVESSEERRLVPDDQVSQDRAQTPETDPKSKTRNSKKWYIVISLVYANFWMAASVSLQAPFFPREVIFALFVFDFWFI